jgi:wyosine [tRNA(Phe)-imidazoG37] synthetase (radical SAM superfamily)
LGTIQVQINERHLFVPTEKVLSDLERSAWRDADVITFSGSGEPTLALNLGEVTDRLKEFTGKPTLVLTNGTLLHRDDVQEELCRSDRVFVKLDAVTDATFRRVNRPVEGVSLPKIIDSLIAFRKRYSGFLGIQSMFVHSSRDRIEDIARVLGRIHPDEVQVNTPTRPYPESWNLSSRGSHDGVDYPAHPLKPVSVERLREIETELSALLPGISVRGVRPRD